MGGILYLLWLKGVYIRTLFVKDVDFAGYRSGEFDQSAGKYFYALVFTIHNQVLEFLCSEPNSGLKQGNAWKILQI